MREIVDRRDDERRGKKQRSAGQREDGKRGRAEGEGQSVQRSRNGANGKEGWKEDGRSMRPGECRERRKEETEGEA